MNDNSDNYNDNGTATIDNKNNTIYDDGGGCDNGKDGDEMMAIVLWCPFVELLLYEYFILSCFIFLTTFQNQDHHLPFTHLGPEFKKDQVTCPKAHISLSWVWP